MRQLKGLLVRPRRVIDVSGCRIFDEIDNSDHMVMTKDTTKEIEPECWNKLTDEARKALSEQGFYSNNSDPDGIS